MWLDDLIGFFSPAAGARRTKQRLAADFMKRNYEGASRSNRMAKWRTTSSSANAEVSGGIELLRSRARDLVRNNPYAKRICDVVSTNTVGKGIVANIKNPDEAAQASQSMLWRKWVETLNFDYDGCADFYGMQSLIMKSVPESGEIIARRRWVDPDRFGFPMQIQLLESDQLVKDRYFRNEKTGNRVVMGVELDKTDTPVAYHIYDTHPGNMGLEGSYTDFNVTRVPAEDIAHIFRKDRPGQVRGVTWLHPVIVRLRELDQFEDAHLVKQKVSACFSAFVHDIQAPDEEAPDDEFDLERLEPGVIEYLPAGKDIKFASPPMPPTGSYEAYVNNVLHSIAAGVGISFEALTGNLAEVNFSSARMGHLEFGRHIDSWRKHMLVPQFNDRVFGWFLEAAAIMGADTAKTFATWTFPKREYVDPTKEIPAKIKAVRAGIETLSDVIRQNGAHPNEHFSELKADNDILDQLDLTLDTDPRKVNSAGTSQGDASGSSENED